MIPATEARYRRLLRWYPKSWREANEDLALGMMLEVAESEGRTTPSRKERVGACLEGLGARLDLRFALTASLVGVLLAGVGGLLFEWAFPQVGRLGAYWLLLLVLTVVVPFLAIVGAISFAREIGLLSSPRSLSVMALASLSLISSYVAQIARMGMIAGLVDGDYSTTGFDVLTWVTGAMAVAVLLGGLLARTRLPAVAAAMIAGAAGVASAPVLAITLSSPYLATIVAGAVAVRSWTLTYPTTATALGEDAQATTRDKRLVGQLLWIGATGTIAGWTIAGAMWSADAVDGQEALTQGITISLLSGLALLGALTVRMTARRSRSIATQAPIVLVAISLIVNAFGYLPTATSFNMRPAFACSAYLVGAAITIWLATRLSGPTGHRVLFATAIGIAYAASLGTTLAALVALGTAITAIFSAVYWTINSRWPSHPAQESTITNPASEAGLPARPNW